MTYYQEHKEEKKAYYQAHKEERKAYREAHKEERKAYYQANKDKFKKHSKEYYESHKDKMKEYRKKWYQEHKDEHKIRCKEWNEEHKEKIKTYQKAYQKTYRKSYNGNDSGTTYKYLKEYLQIDDNKKKHCTRQKSNQYLFKTLKHTKIKEYEIHHCFGYDDFKHFIYIPKELHQEIHQFLRDNNISADSNHFSQIEHIIANYLKQNDKHILILK